MRRRNESSPYCVASDRNREHEIQNWAPRLGETPIVIGILTMKFKIEHRAWARRAINSKLSTAPKRDARFKGQKPQTDQNIMWLWRSDAFWLVIHNQRAPDVHKHITFYSWTWWRFAQHIRRVENWDSKKRMFGWSQMQIASNKQMKLKNEHRA